MNGQLYALIWFAPESHMDFEPLWWSSGGVFFPWMRLHCLTPSSCMLPTSLSSCQTVCSNNTNDCIPLLSLSWFNVGRLHHHSTIWIKSNASLQFWYVWKGTMVSIRTLFLVIILQFTSAKCHGYDFVKHL